MQGYTDGNEATDLTFKFWLSHNSVLDAEDDYELLYMPSHNDLGIDRTANTEHTITLNHDSTGGTPLVITFYFYFCSNFRRIWTYFMLIFKSTVFKLGVLTW